MAGHRRGTDTPRRADARPARRKRTIDERIAATQDPRRRIAIAFDYLRMLFVDLSPAQQREFGRRVVNTLRKLADECQTMNR